MSDNHPVKWADRAMFEAQPMERDRGGHVVPKVYLVSATPDPLGSIAAACRMYEGKATHNLSHITDDDRRYYWGQVKKTHLKAPLEFVDLHFFIEGVTRAFTHQIVRQRTAVYAQESLRFAVKDNMADEVALPPSISQLPNEHPMRQMYQETVDKIEESYNYLISQGIPAEDARHLLPHAVTTRLNYKTNLRNLLEHAGNRLCTQAQYEWRHVFYGIVKAIAMQNAPYASTETNDDGDFNIVDGQSNWQWDLIAKDSVFAPVCYAMGKCPFKADFDRQCVIRERVEAHAAKGEPSEQWDDIYSSEWMLDPTAGRRDA